MTPEKLFGCYNEFFNRKDLAYLNLLRMKSGLIDHSAIVYLGKLRSSPTWIEDSVRLLTQQNWRGHLPVITSYVASGGNCSEVELSAWSAIGRGSWVTPQLIAGLHVTGNDVVPPAMRVLTTGVEVTTVNPLLRHVESGPGSSASRVGKLLNSVIGLGLRARIPLSDTELSDIADTDFDKANEISARWKESLLSLLDYTE